MSASEYVADQATTISITVPDWFLWVFIALAVVHLGLSIWHTLLVRKSTKLRQHLLALTRGKR